jgi:DNA-binding response OmpR family regulator
LYLTDAGYDVVEAGDGESALRLAEEKKIALAAVDVILPGYSGVAVLETLRTASTMPILLISSLSEKEVAWKTNGAQGFMRKPLRPKDLVSRVGALLAPASDESSEKTSSISHAFEARFEYVVLLSYEEAVGLGKKAPPRRSPLPKG